MGAAVTAPVVRVAGLRHVYPDGHVGLDRVDLTVAVGERVAILGPNGAGKTTLMLSLNGVLTPTQGSVAIGETTLVVSMTELADRSPAHLSLGQRRRAALATVLACHPEVLVLDEPSANLDPLARRELAETLSGLRATILVVTHDLPYAAQLCTRAVILDAGRVVADGATSEILGDADLLAAHRLELPWGFSVSR